MAETAKVQYYASLAEEAAKNGKAFDISDTDSKSLPNMIETIAGDLAAKYWEDHKEQILDIARDSFL